MQSAGLADNTETAEKVNDEILQKMSNDEPGPELSVNEHSDVPQVVRTDADADADADADVNANADANANAAEKKNPGT